jgi:diguanylate cyclase (GGDEF)-like protein/PAS domain S-box-containing protein
MKGRAMHAEDPAETPTLDAFEAGSLLGGLPQSQVERSRLLQAFLDHSAEAFFVSRVTDGRIVYVNRRCCTLSGYTQAELLSMSVRDISDIFNSQSFSARIEEYRRVGRISFETIHRLKGGRSIPVEVSLSYVPGIDGGVDHTVGVVRSLEERERVAVALRETEARWRQALERRESLSRSLVRLSQALESIQQAADVIDVVQQEIHLTLGLDNVWLYQLDESRRTLRLLSCLGPEAEFGSDERLTRLGVADSPWLQRVLGSGLPVLIRDLDDRQDLSDADRRYLGLGRCRMLMAVALRQHDRPLGLLGCGRFTGEGKPGATGAVVDHAAADIEFLASVSERVSVTLDRIRIHSELRSAFERLQSSEAVLRHAQSVAEVGHWTYDVASGLFHDSGPLAQALGLGPDARFSFEQLLHVVFPEDRPRLIQVWRPVPDRQPREFEFRYRMGAQVRWIQVRAEAQFNAFNWIVRVIGVSRDITARRLSELVQRTRLAVLDRVVRADRLSEVLDEVAHRLEEVHAEWHVAIVLVDQHDGRARTVAAPTLPDWFSERLDRLGVALGAGSSGSALYLGDPVLVTELADSSYWQDLHPEIERLGARSGWSLPFKDETGRVLGSFSVYRAEPGLPCQAARTLLDEFVDIVALAVQRVQAGEALRQAATVFESTHDGVLITDLRSNIVAVNQAYCRITGYPESMLLGCNPSMLQSGRHDAAFYRQLWDSVNQQGYWQGEMWNRRRSGELYPQWVTISTVRDDRGEPSHYVGVCTDISRIKQSEQQLERLAHYDPLTGLPNRLLAQSRLAHALERARHPGSGLAVLFIDLDRFKGVNDSLGHAMGDELLAAFAQRLLTQIEPTDTLARLGGDEFLLIRERVDHPSEVASLGQSLIDALETPFLMASGQVLFMTASIGVSLFPDDGTTADELIQHADSAMYQSKLGGRSTLRFYTESLTHAANERLDLELRMRRALGRSDEFHLRFQPVLTVQPDRGCRRIGVEALLRWDCPGRGAVDPARFISLAEETGLILPLGEWVLDAACRQARAWLEQGQGLGVAVNLSPRQFRQAGLVETIRTALRTHQLPPELLELEITESVLMDCPQTAIETLQALRRLGVQLAIDDFGTGYSSLAYLKRFPVHKLKIDQSFVRELAQQTSDQAIVQATITMAHSLGMTTQAEGVETLSQFRLLRRMGCDFVQGYLFGAAQPAGSISLSSSGRRSDSVGVPGAPVAARPSRS